ncbi:hypothetical protein O181_055734 [Austropuccinia psidii MF-1]|uniref:Uncharacterized protein n=1 Tax=Austropuccinia psidii MF-1 TaxID=1389203 RepID=A0A9Q3E777_9BASI|nr:hypothetical protein [Austropuccinia psidii MF-1]
MAKKLYGHHFSVHGLWQPPEATNSAASQVSLSSMIIYHYAQFLLSNPMVTLSGPIQMIPNKVPNTSPILKEDFSAIQSGNSLEATRRPFNDPNHLALQELGCVTGLNVIYNLPVLIGLSNNLIAFFARVPFAEVWQTAL